MTGRSVPRRWLRFATFTGPTKRGDDASAKSSSTSATKGIRWWETKTAIRTANSSRVVTVKSTDNIKLLNGDYVMDSTQKTMLVMYLHGTGFLEVSRGYHTFSTLATDLNCNTKKLSTIGKMGFATANTKTIASGSITIDRFQTFVATEGGAPEDDLDTIAGGAVGDEIVIWGGSAGGVTLRSLLGNLRLKNDENCRLSGFRECIRLLQQTDFAWCEISRSNPKLKDLYDPDKSVPWEQTIVVPGTLVINTTYKPRIYVRRDVIIERIAAAVGTAPVAVSCIVDLHDDGASIFAAEGEMANIAAGQTTALSTVKNAAVLGGSYLTARTGTSVGTAADLTVTIIGRGARIP